MKGYLIFVMTFMLTAGLVSAAENPITISTFEPSESPISEGETITLSVTVQNTDENSSLTTSTAKVCLPSGLSFTTTNETCATKTLTQDGQAEGTIAAGGQVSKTWQISGDVADSYEITVNAEGYLGSDKYTKDKDTSLTVTSSTPLTLSLIDDITGTIYPGSGFTLSALISNTGGSDATDVQTKLTSSCVSSSPATGVWRDVTSTGQSPGTVASGKSVSISWSVTAGSTTGSCNLNVDVVSDESGNPSDIKTITISSIGGDDGNGGNGGGPGGGGGPPGEKNATRTQALNPGIGLQNNTRLQAAIQKVLGLANMSEQARENLLRLSASISSQVRLERNFRSANRTSSMETRLRYEATQRARNFMLFDTVPKDFAQHSDNITVTAPGATLEVVGADPEYLFTYPQLDPGQEVVITYSVGATVSEGVIDSFSGEVYAQALEEAPVVVCTEGQARCSLNDLQLCQDGAWVFQETCHYGCSGGACSTVPPAGPGDYTWIIIIVVAIIAVAGLAVIFLKRKPSVRTGPAQTKKTPEPLTPGQQPYRPGTSQTPHSAYDRLRSSDYSYSEEE